MTEQNIPEVTDDDRKLARKWAAYIESNTDYRGDSSKDPWGDRVRAAAHVILRDIPAAPRPTLADMSEEERRDCQWMQCEVRGERRIIVLILDDSDENYVVTLDSSGYISHCPLEWVTPLPDLPRMTWPGTEKDEGANTTKIGDVIESATDPRLDALPAGTVLLDRDNDAVTKEGESWAGLGYQPTPNEGDNLGPWKVVHIGWENG